MKVFIKVSESDKPKMLEDLRAARVHATERIKVVAQQHPDGRPQTPVAVTLGP